MDYHDEQSLKPIPQGQKYFDLDDILASQEKIPAKFESPFYRLGFLDANNADDHIQAGTKLDLPHWLAKELNTSRRQLVSIEIPRCYGENYRQIFKADAEVLDLHKFGPYFYEFGIKLLYFDHSDSEGIARSLLQVFLQRFRRLFDASQNANADERPAMTDQLDNLEKKLFSKGQESNQQFQKWLLGQRGQLKTSKSIEMSRKRKRSDGS